MNAQLVWSLLVKGAGILAIALVAAVVTRRKSASVRHLVWLTCLCGLLVVPLAEVRLPDWNVSVAKAPVTAPLIMPAPLTQTVSSLTIPKNMYVRDLAAPDMLPEETREIPWGSIVFGIWAIGAAVLLAWMTFGLLQVWRLVRSGREYPLPQEIENAVPHRTRVLICPTLRVPATAGLLRPAILLPEEAKLWGASRLEMVLAHESAHILRSDWLWQIIGQAACAIHFFNPLAWFALRKMRNESEFASDDYVLTLGIEPTSYAHQLLDIARTSRFRFAAIVGMARSNKVEDRLKSIIDGNRSRKWASGRASISVLVLALLLVVPVALLKAVPVVIAKMVDDDWKASIRHSHKPMPHIPWVASKEVAPNVFLAKNGIAGLPAGYRVRLVAVSNDNQIPWGLDGKTLPDATDWQQGGIFWQGNTFHNWRHGSVPRISALNRSFHLEVESEDDARPGFTTEIASPRRTTDLQKLNPVYAGADDRLPQIDLPARDPAYSIIELCLPSKSDTATLRVGFAGSDWTTIADVRNPVQLVPSQIAQGNHGDGRLSDDCGVSLDEIPGLFATLKDRNQQVSVRLGDGQPRIADDLARRVLLFDKQGNAMELPKDPRYTTSGYPIYHLSAEEFCKIGRAVLQTTSYEWAEFRDIPIRPNIEEEEAHRLDSGVRGTATGIAPGFTQKLANGATVSLAAVTKAVLDGQAWKMSGQPSWRGDGKVLAKGPGDMDFAHPIVPWGKNPLFRFDVQFAGVARDANTFIEAMGQVDPTFWLRFKPVTGEFGTYEETAYLPSATTGDLRVGVANGPWRVLAKQEVDMPELPALPETENRPSSSPTGFTVLLSQKVTFTDDAAKKTRILVDKVPQGCAIRAVAILKSGRNVQLRESGSGRQGAEFFMVAGRQGEFGESYSNILASEVKEVQIQSRPYEWAEFHNIPLSPR